MALFFYTLGVLTLTAGLGVFAYLDRVFRDLDRVTAGRLRAHLETFEAEIEPRFHAERRKIALSATLLARFWLVLVAALTARGVIFFVPGSWEAAAEMTCFLAAEVIVMMQFVPSVLVASLPGNWMLPFVPFVRFFVWLIWPVQAVLELLVSVLHLAEEEPTTEAVEQNAIEAFMDAATEGGIIEQEEARLIEQVVEFGDKRVRDVMTPRSEVIAIRADASLEELGQRAVETKFSRLPVYEVSLDEIVGVVMARDMLEVADTDASHRKVRELMRPALFVPETKFGAELLKEMQQKNQQMAIVINEYGLMSGIVTAEDLVEEIVGDIGEEDRHAIPDVIREADGSVILRGSVSVDKLQEIFGIEIERVSETATASTIAGFLNSIAGHVPGTGEVLEFDGLRFEVLEANQRKVLKVHARQVSAPGATTSAANS